MDSKIKYSIKAGYNEMDFDKITDMLKDAFWCIGIKKNEIIQGAQNSALLAGAFQPLLKRNQPVSIWQEWTNRSARVMTSSGMRMAVG